MHACWHSWNAPSFDCVSPNSMSEQLRRRSGVADGQLAVAALGQSTPIVHAQDCSISQSSKSPHVSGD